MKKILLTGCQGQLGRAIRLEYADKADFMLTELSAEEGISALDIADLDQVRSAVSAFSPDVIINCAAYTNVDGCEKNYDLAYSANAVGPKNLATAAAESGCRLVHISTDYVFRGDGIRPYVETDEPDPISAYGRTKLAAETSIREIFDDYLILRTAWLYGEGKNFVRTMLAVAENHDEVSVVCDQKGSPTSASELAAMIHFLLDAGASGLFHATCEGDTNWADFTEEIYRLAGKNVRVRHVTSEQYAEANPDAARRPKYSILENAHLKQLTDEFSMAGWQDAIAVYMREMGY
ncbi:MAG: dTDP-4-dehydrorhamnose reductase [Lachnospiraceae bacterium]|nr:dTDP-4-dehydrorhamnose reductase [Lachnospiraceae bacterium]